MMAQSSAYRRRVYLAGPDVFLPNAAALLERKQELCAKHGFVGLSPFDNEVDRSGLSKHEVALRIGAANEEMIRSCDLVIANLTPFRGPSAGRFTKWVLRGRLVCRYSRTPTLPAACSTVPGDGSETGSSSALTVNLPISST
jgi:hypothetical protein